MVKSMVSQIEHDLLNKTNLQPHVVRSVVFSILKRICQKRMNKYPEITIIAPGLLDPKGDADMVKSMVSQIEHDLFNKTNLQPHVVRSVVFSILKRICQKRMNKYPEIRVHVERV